MPDVAIVIPIYLKRPSVEDQMALLQCSRILGSHKIIIFSPETLDLEEYKKLLPSAMIERFDDSFFTGTKSYSKLLLSPDFYKRFSCFEYILIYQTDAWVFRDELDFWCKQGYDCIGAPLFKELTSKKERIYIGNGGFSLRRIQAFLNFFSSRGLLFRPNKHLQIAGTYFSRGTVWRALYQPLKLVGWKNTFHQYLTHTIQTGENEDFFWAEINETDAYHGLHVPDVSVAMRFSMEHRAPDLYKKNGNRLPFGCHGWNRVESEFWHPFIYEKLERSF